MTYRIEQARKEKGWTQDQLAEAMNTSSVQISRWETGKRDPQTATLIKIADAKGWTQDQLAEAMNTSSVQISRWETGKRDPQTATLIKIADALGVSLD